MSKAERSAVKKAKEKSMSAKIKLSILAIFRKMQIKICWKSDIWVLLVKCIVE